MIPLLTGPALRLIGYAALAVSLAGGAAWALHTHDARVRVEQQVAIDRATAAEVARQHEATIAALEQLRAEAEMRAGYFEHIRTSIHGQPATTACLGSPAIRVLLDGMRRPVRRDDTTTADPAKHARVSR